MWLSKALYLLFLSAVARAQIPSLGWCPDYQAMADFNMNRFLGQWHEAERYFTVTELGSRCVTTNYEKMPDGRVWVSNEIKNSFTGVKRVLDGQLQVVGRDGEGKISVKYTSLPVPYDTQYSILDTDYDNFAVVWSCSGIGPVHTQNAWIMTRERLAPGLIMQRAYGVLDRYKISRAFFVKTNQEDCTVQPPPIEAIDPTESPAIKKVKEPAQGKDAEGGQLLAQEQLPSQELSAPAPPANAEPSAPVSVPELILSAASDQQNQLASDIREDPKLQPEAASPLQEAPHAEKQQPAAKSDDVPEQPEPAQSKSVPDVVVEDQQQIISVSEVASPVQVAHAEVPQADHQLAPAGKSEVNPDQKVEKVSV